MHFADGRQKVSRRAILQQIAPGAILQRPKDALVAIVGGEYQNASIREVGSNCTDRCDAVQFRHGQVHQDDIGLQLPEPGDAFMTVPGMTSDSHVLLELQNGCQAVANDVMVFGDQNADLIRHSAP